MHTISVLTSNCSSANQHRMKTNSYTLMSYYLVFPQINKSLSSQKKMKSRSMKLKEIIPTNIQICQHAGFLYKSPSDKL